MPKEGMMRIDCVYYDDGDGGGGDDACVHPMDQIEAFPMVQMVVVVGIGRMDHH